MKKWIGFILFWVAIGMLIMLVIPNEFLGVLLIVTFLFIGYHLYCDGS